MANGNAANWKLEDFDILQLSFKNDQGNLVTWSDYGNMFSHINHAFIINDLQFIIPPEKISSTEENNYMAVQSIRSRNSDKLPVGIANEIFSVSFTLPGKSSIKNIDSRDDHTSGNNTGKRGGILDFILQFKNSPFSVIENATLRTKLKIPIFHNMVFCMHNLALTTSPGEPDTILGTLTFTPMSYACYSDFWHYKKNWISKGGQSFEDVNEINLPNRNPYLTEENKKALLLDNLERWFANTRADSTYIAGINAQLLAGNEPPGDATYMVDPAYQTAESLHKLDVNFMLNPERTQFARESEPYKAYIDWLYSRHKQKNIGNGEVFDCTKISPYNSTEQNLGDRVYLKWKEFQHITVDPVVAEAIRNGIRLRLKNFKLRLFKNVLGPSNMTAEEAAALKESETLGSGKQSQSGSNDAVTGSGKINFFGKFFVPRNSSTFAAIRSATTREEFNGKEITALRPDGSALNPSGYYFHKGIDIMPSYPAGPKGRDVAVPIFTPFKIRITENTCFDDLAYKVAIYNGGNSPEKQIVVRGNQNWKRHVDAPEGGNWKWNGSTYKIDVYRFSDLTHKGDTGAKGNSIIGVILDGPFKGKKIRFWHLATFAPIAVDRQSETFKVFKEQYRINFGVGAVIDAGEWIGAYLGGTAVDNDEPHLHVELGGEETGKGSLHDRIDITPLLLNAKSDPPKDIINAYYKLKQENRGNYTEEEATYENLNDLKGRNLKGAPGNTEGIIKSAVKFALENGANSSWRTATNPETKKPYESFDEYLTANEDEITRYRDQRPWEYYALQVRAYQEAGWNLYEGDLTNFDLFYREHTLELVSGNDAESRQIEYPLICDFISATSSNNFKMLNVQGIMAPTAQFLGSQDDTFLLSMKGFGLNSIKQLEVVRDTLRKQGVMFKHIPESYSLRVENNFINAFGNVYFVINGIEMAAVPEQPNVYACEMRLTSNDINIKQQVLKKESVMGNQEIKESFLREFLGGSDYNPAGLFPPGTSRTKEQEDAYEAALVTAQTYQEERKKKGLPYIERKKVTVDGDGVYLLTLNVDLSPENKQTDVYLSSNRYLLEILAHINMVNNLFPKDSYYQDADTDLAAIEPGDGITQEDIEQIKLRERYVFTDEGFVSYIPDKRITNFYAPWLQPTKARDAAYTDSSMMFYYKSYPEHSNISLLPEPTTDYIKFVSESNPFVGRVAPPAWDWMLERPGTVLNNDLTDTVLRPFAFINWKGGVGSYQRAYGTWLTQIAGRAKTDVKVAEGDISSGVVQVDGLGVTCHIPGTFYPYLMAHRNVLALAQNTRAIRRFYDISLTVLETGNDFVEMVSDTWWGIRSETGKAVAVFLIQEAITYVGLLLLEGATVGLASPLAVAKAANSAKRAAELAKVIKAASQLKKMAVAGGKAKSLASASKGSVAAAANYRKAVIAADELAKTALEAESKRFIGRYMWHRKNASYLHASTNGYKKAALFATRVTSGVLVGGFALKNLADRVEAERNTDQHAPFYDYFYKFDQSKRSLRPWGNDILDSRANGKLIYQETLKFEYEKESEIKDIDYMQLYSITLTNGYEQFLKTLNKAEARANGTAPDAIGELFAETKVGEKFDLDQQNAQSLSTGLFGGVGAAPESYPLFKKLRIGAAEASLIGQDFIDYVWEALAIPYLNNVLRFSEIQKVVRYTDWFPETKKLLSKISADLTAPSYDDLELPHHPYWNARGSSGLANKLRGSSFTDPDFYLANPGIDYFGGEEVGPDMSDYVVAIEALNPDNLPEGGQKPEAGQKVSEVLGEQYNGDSRVFVPGVSMNEFRNLFIDVHFEKCLGEMQGLATVETSPRRIFGARTFQADGVSFDGDNNPNIAAMSKTEADEAAFAGARRNVCSEYLSRFNASSSHKMSRDGKSRVPIASAGAAAAEADSAESLASPNVASWNDLSLMFGDNIDLLSPLAGGLNPNDPIFGNKVLNYTYQQYDSLGTEYYLNMVRSNFLLRQNQEITNDVTANLENAKILRPRAGNHGTDGVTGAERANATGENKDDKMPSSQTLAKTNEINEKIKAKWKQWEPLVFDYTGSSQTSLAAGGSGAYAQTAQFRTPMKIKLATALKSINRPKLAARRAFPVVKVFFFEEDEIFSKQWLSFDEVFSYSKIESLNISDSRKRPAAICTITFSDVNGLLSGFNQWNKASTSMQPSILEADLYGQEDANPITADTVLEQNEYNFSIAPGLKIKVCLGFSNDSNKLEEVFLGEITDVQMEGMSSRMSITAQSYGAELVAQIKGAKSEWGSASEPLSFDTTFSTLASLMFSSEVVHFGKRRLGDIVMFGEDQSLEKHMLQFKETVNLGALYNSGRKGGNLGWVAWMSDSTWADSAGWNATGAMTAAARQKGISPIEGPQDDNIFAPNPNASQIIMWSDAAGRWVKGLGGEFTVTDDGAYFKSAAVYDNEYIPGVVFDEFAATTAAQAQLEQSVVIPPAPASSPAPAPASGPAAAPAPAPGTPPPAVPVARPGP